jgi:toxin ParE1/3/4
MARVIKRSVAERDLDDIASYLQQTSPRTAIRFLEAVDQACERLADMPGLGGECESDKPSLAGVRLWTIRGFKKYVILYRPIEDGIEVLRIVYGARDIERLF